MRSLLLAIVIAVGVQPAAAEGCSPELVAQVPARIDAAGRPYVSLNINGTAVEAVICTGCEWSSLGERVADRLSLRKSTGRLRWSYSDGSAIDTYTHVEQSDIRGVQLPANAQYLIHRNTDYSTIGINLLSYYDFELDYERSQMSLYKRSRCGPPKNRWLANSAQISFAFLHGQMLVGLTANGRTLRSTVATQLPNTTMDLDVADANFAITRFVPGVARLGPEAARSFTYSIPSMRVGDISFSAVPLTLIDAKGLGSHIGANELRQLKLYFSWERKTIYAQQNMATQPARSEPVVPTIPLEFGTSRPGQRPGGVTTPNTF